MFRSKTRNLIFPQSEHLRLCGALALHWGNADFERPSMDFDSFVTGVALHDWGHGFFDVNEIGAMDEAARLASATRLVQAHLADPVAETVMQHHVRRLLGDDAANAELRMLLDGAIDENVRALGMPLELFRRADRITNLLDLISFDFCFDVPQQRTVPVYARSGDPQQTDIVYTIHPQGLVTMTPWPLRVESLEGYIVAYRADIYPEDLEAHVIPYHIRAAAAR